MTTAIYINNRPLEEWGLKVISMAWLRIASRQVPMVAYEGRQGEEFSEQGIRTQRPPMPLRCELPASSLLARRRLLDTVALALEGENEIRVADDPDRVLYGMLREASGNPDDPQFVEVNSRPDFTIVFGNPNWFDRYAQQLVIPTASQPKTVPVGTAPHAGRVWFKDASASRTIQVLNFRGDVIGSMTLTGTLAAGHYGEIDCDTGYVYDVNGNSKVDVTGTWLASGTDDFFVFDPRDKPMLKHGGTGDLVHLFRRSYRV